MAVESLNVKQEDSSKVGYLRLALVGDINCGEMFLPLVMAYPPVSTSSVSIFCRHKPERF